MFLGILETLTGKDLFFFDWYHGYTVKIDSFDSYSFGRLVMGMSCCWSVLVVSF